MNNSSPNSGQQSPRPVPAVPAVPRSLLDLFQQQRPVEQPAVLDTDAASPQPSSCPNLRPNLRSNLRLFDGNQAEGDEVVAIQSACCLLSIH